MIVYNKYEILISNVPDREYLVAEVWYHGLLIAEISQETESLKLELYPINSTDNVHGFQELIQVFQKAKIHLIVHFPEES